MKLLSSQQVSALLNSLGLTSSLFKPIPDLVGSLTAPLDGVVSAVDGITHSLGLPGLEDLPLIGSILEAEDPSKITNPYKSLAVLNQEILAAEDACHVQPYDPPPVLSQTFPAFDKAKANIFRYRQQQSVNLGSWFVHEQWMTPSVFTCASGPQMAEIDIATGWNGTQNAKALLERHWDTFINQTDFQYLSSIGINTVRLPVGYWNLGPLYCQGTPFEPVADVYENSWSRIIRAINWAGEAGIGVLVDMHGAVGSQNGQPHSGVSDGQSNFFGNATNQDATIRALTYLTQQLATVTNVVGIEILNEPTDDASLPDFYTRAITTMRQASPEAEDFPLYIHDGFNLEQYSDFISSRKDFVVEDHHSYFVFDGNGTSNSPAQNTKEVDGSVSGELASASKNERRNFVVGEWSCALSPDSLDKAENAQDARQQFCEGQEQVYTNTSAGWYFWSYMKEDCDSDLDWCFRNAVGKTLPTTFFSYNSSNHSSPAKTAFIARSVSQMQLPPMTEVLDQANPQESAASMSASTSSSSASTSSSSMSASSVSTSAASEISSMGSRKKHGDSAHHQRFLAIHSRRAHLHDPPYVQEYKRDNSTSNSGLPAALMNLTETERSITKGYSDGFMTAKIFAQYGMSRLGFRGQYIGDSIAKLGDGIVAPGTESEYAVWFYKGLGDAEQIIGTVVGN